VLIKFNGKYLLLNFSGYKYSFNIQVLIEALQPIINYISNFPAEKKYYFIFKDEKLF